MEEGIVAEDVCVGEGAAEVNWRHLEASLYLSIKIIYVETMYNENQIKAKLTELRAMSSENEVVEFKEAKGKFDFDKLGQYFSALSNEANLQKVDAAWLVFGIKDKDHSIVGTQYKYELKALMSLKKSIADKTNGRFTFKEIHTFQVDGLRVIMFEIPPAPQGIPISYSDHYYARDHESTCGLSIEKIERIRAQATKYDWSAEIIPHATIADLDPIAIQFAKIKFIEKKPERAEEVKSWSDEKFLDKAKLTIKGEITRTALILLGSEESEHFINPSECKIRWKLLDKDGDSLGYEILHIPMIRSVEKLYALIRNLKYRYIPDGTLFPEEIDKYDPYNIREALNNCIAHQDYKIGGRINVIERPYSITFTNKGRFLPNSVQDVVTKDIPEEEYRNPFLVSAMHNLKMVDTEGGGIRKMFNIQARRYFPLPDYDISDGRVAVTIVGKVIDMEYARLLAQHNDLTLLDIILLDKVQKKASITDEELKYLRSNKLVEGRKGNVHLSKVVAQSTGQKGRYTKVVGFDKKYYLDLILQAIKTHEAMSRAEIDELLFDKLSDSLDELQKKNKIMNMIQELRRNGKIRNEGTRENSKWVLS